MIVPQAVLIVLVGLGAQIGSTSAKEFEDTEAFNCVYRIKPNASSLSFFKPKDSWGRKKVDSLNFESPKKLSDFLKVVEGLIGEIVETHAYNNLYRFKDFYYEYYGNGHGNVVLLSDFYNNRYTPIFGPNEGHDHASMSTALLQKIRKHFASEFSAIDASLNLCAAVKEPNKEFVASFHDAGKEPPQLEYYDHVLGSLKITIGPKKGDQQRKGHILFEAGDGIVTPIIVMEDEQAPHGESGPYGERKLKYSYLSENRNYIVATPASPPNGTQNTYAYWIYVGRSYCNFLDKTTKYDILTPIKTVFKRNKKGERLGGFYISIKTEGTLTPPLEKILYSNLQACEYYFVFFIKEGEGKPEMKYPVRIQIGYFDKYDADWKSDEAKDVAHKVEKLLGFEENYFDLIFQTMGTILYHKSFMEQLRELNLPSREIHHKKLLGCLPTF